MRPLVCAVVGVVALVVATGCGSSGGGGTPRASDPVGKWVASPAVFAAPSGSTAHGNGPEPQRAIAVQDGWAALGTINQRDFAAWRSRDGVHWHLTEYGSATAADPFPSFNAIVRRGHNLVAAGTSDEHPAIWTSPDKGDSWVRLRSPILDRAGSISAAVVVRNMVALVGQLGSFNPPARPAAWSMPDLTHVAPAVVSNTPPGPGAMTGVASAGGRLVAVGTIGEGPAAWISRNAGTSWTPQPKIAGRGAMQSVASLRNDLVANGQRWQQPDATEADGFVWLGNRDGSSWQPVARQTGAFGDGQSVQIFQLDAFRTAALMTGAAHDRANPNFCYDDLTTCDRQSSVLWLSTDERTWGRVAVPGTERNDRYTTFATDADGLLLLGGRFDYRNGSSSNRVWRWTGPAGSLPASVVPPEQQFKKPRFELITDYDAHLEIGRTYRFPVPLGSSCGGGKLSFNNTRWKTEEPWGDAPYPKSWPVRHEEVSDGPTDHLYGTVRIVDAHHLEVGLEDGTTLRTYAPFVDTDMPCG